jgi:hypothetical protein
MWLARKTFQTISIGSVFVCLLVRWGWECYCGGLTMELVYSVYPYTTVLIKVGLTVESFNTVL